MTWVTTIARRAAWKCARREAIYRRLLSSLDDVADSCRTLEDRRPVGPTACLRLEAVEILEVAVPNPVWREIWLLYNDPGQALSARELAERTGYSVGTIAVILSRVRRRIREESRRRDGLGAAATR